MTSYLGHDPDLIEDSVYALFEREAGVSRIPIASLIHPTRVDHMHLLPASTSLTTVDRRFANRDGMGLVLKRSLQQLKAHYHYVLIDCPPIFGILMLNALVACERLVIPVQTEYLALKGLERMMHTLQMVARGGRGRVDHLIVPTMFDSTHQSFQGQHA